MTKFQRTAPIPPPKVPYSCVNGKLFLAIVAMSGIGMATSVALLDSCSTAAIGMSLTYASYLGKLGPDVQTDKEQSSREKSERPAKQPASKSVWSLRMSACVVSLSWGQSLMSDIRNCRLCGCYGRVWVRGLCRNCCRDHWSVTPREFVDLGLTVEEPVWPRRLWVWSMLLGEYGWKDFSCQESLDDWLRRNPH